MLRKYTALSFLVLLSCVCTARAQWTEQTIRLRPGWNAIFLEIDPQPRECAAVIGNLPVEKLIGWNRGISTVQFLYDPNTLLPSDSDWLFYLPPGHPLSAQNNLYILQGGRTYLVKMPDNFPASNWVIPGQPVVKPATWLPDSFNLVGFNVSQTPPADYKSFFENSVAHANAGIYRLATSGAWVKVDYPSSTSMAPGEAFWIWCSGNSEYQGPVQVTCEQSAGLAFGRLLVEQTLKLRNTSARPRTVTLRQLQSLSPPSTAYPAYKGDVLLSYWQTSASNLGVWTNLNSALAHSLAPGETWELRLAVRRAEMTPLDSSRGALYQSLLEVTDNLGACRRLVPVSAAQNTMAGLWVGAALINKVSEPESGNPAFEQDTASPFQLRLILHVNDSGQVSLLQKVLQLWKNGQSGAPGRFVLLSDEKYGTNLVGATIRDGRQVGRRLSSVGFSFRDPALMSSSGSFGVAGNSNYCRIELPFDDPLNPFVHRFHPDHNNLTDRPDEALSRTTDQGPSFTAESYTVVRQISLVCTANDPYSLPLPGRGDTLLVGDYREVIEGLHRSSLFVKGTFQLHRASDISTLDDPN